MAQHDATPGPTADRAHSGIPGLDAVLRGGFTRDRVYLVEGEPGTGKTTLALQFLLAGRDAGESTLYVTLSESEQELRAVATSHGFTGVPVYEGGVEPLLDRGP